MKGAADVPFHLSRRLKSSMSLLVPSVVMAASFLILMASMSIAAQDKGSVQHALHVSMHQTRFEIRSAETASLVRTSFLEAPRRFTVDLYFSRESPGLTDGTVPVSLDRRIEKITYSRHPDHLHYTFFLKKGTPLQYRVEKESSAIHVVFESPLEENEAKPYPVPKSSSILSCSSPPGNPSPVFDHGPNKNTQVSFATGESSLETRQTVPTTQTASFVNSVENASHVSTDEPAPEQAPKNALERLRFRGFLEVTGGLDLKKDDSFEHTQTFRNRVRLESKLPLETPLQNSHVLVSGESDTLWFGPHRDWNDHEFKLYETYFHGTKGPWELRLGKQIIRWGKTDQLSPVDNVNPQDLRQFLVPTLEERKIPNWMARVRFLREPLSFEVVAIPFFEPADIDFFGTDWAVFRHTREVLKKAPLPAPLQKAVASVGIDENEPSHTFRNTQWGLRTGITLSGWDLAASYLYAWNPMPFITSFPVKGIRSNGSFDPDEIIKATFQGTLVPGNVTVDYQRTHTFGFEWETVLGPFGFRGETALSSHAVFLRSDLTSVTQRILFSVAGIDRTWPHDWYTNLQLGHQVLLDYDDSVLYFKRHNVSLNGEIRKDFLRGDLEARLRGMIMLTDGGSTWNPSLTYRRFAPLAVSAGLNLFAGPSDTFLGTYSHNDQAYVTLRYDF
ncbi:MAG: DUF1302 family protein [Desulfosoma sp.]